MPYLSRIWLNPLRTQAQALLRNPHRMHAAVLGGLSRQPVTERVLWRLEAKPHRLGVLVLTESRPSWEHLIEQAGWPGSDEPQALVKPYEPLLAMVVRGREFAFRLKANPTSTTKKPAAPSQAQRQRLAGNPRPRGVRVAHRTAAHQLQWLLDRIGTWGFQPVVVDDVPAVGVVERGRLEFTKPRPGTNGANRGTNRVVLQTATFEGLLRVEDPDTARERLLSGIGPGKAYGLGLLTLAPPSQHRGQG